MKTSKLIVGAAARIFETLRNFKVSSSTTNQKSASRNSSHLHLKPKAEEYILVRTQTIA